MLCKLEVYVLAFSSLLGQDLLKSRVQALFIMDKLCSVD